MVVPTASALVAASGAVARRGKARGRGYCPNPPRPSTVVQNSFVGIGHGRIAPEGEEQLLAAENIPSKEIFFFFQKPFVGAKD